MDNEVKTHTADTVMTDDTTTLITHNDPDTMMAGDTQLAGDKQLAGDTVMANHTVIAGHDPIIQITFVTFITHDFANPFVSHSFPFHLLQLHFVIFLSIIFARFNPSLTALRTLPALILHAFLLPFIGAWPVLPMDVFLPPNNKL